MKSFGEIVRTALLSAALLGSLGYAAVAHVTPPPAPAAVVAQAPSSAPFYVARERHPAIRTALKHLRAAQRALAVGAHDFGGHRAAALNLVNQAIDQCNQALRSDRH